MKKNKILTIILIFFALLIGFTSSCLAVNDNIFTFTINDTEYKFNDFKSFTTGIDYDDFIVYYTKSNMPGGQPPIYYYYIQFYKGSVPTFDQNGYFDSGDNSVLSLRLYADSYSGTDLLKYEWENLRFY